MEEIKIPRTLDETIMVLDNMKIDDRDEWLKEPADKILGISHSGLGMWIRNNWGLWAEKPNELKQWFIDNYFIDHPDDISSMILVNYHQVKNGSIPNLNKEANKYHKHWEKCIPNYKFKMRKFKLNKLCSKLENM